MHLCNAIKGIGLGAAALTVAGIANAAPTTTTMMPPVTAVESAAVHCWYSHGVRHCRGTRSYGYHSYGNPYALRTGSNRLWRAMQREDRAGNK